MNKVSKVILPVVGMGRTFRLPPRPRYVAEFER
jgi:hypothetical protein